MSDSFDPDKAARSEPSHLYLRCLQNPHIIPMVLKVTNLTLYIGITILALKFEQIHITNNMSKML